MEVHAFPRIGGMPVSGVTSAQDLTPLFEPFVGREHGGCALVAPVDELEEEHGAGLADRQVADLVDDQERGIGEDLEAASELTGGLGFFERGDEIGQSAVVDSAPALRRRNGKADRQWCTASAAAALTCMSSPRGATWRPAGASTSRRRAGRRHSTRSATPSTPNRAGAGRMTRRGCGCSNPGTAPTSRRPSCGPASHSSPPPAI